MNVSSEHLDAGDEPAPKTPEFARLERFLNISAYGRTLIGCVMLYAAGAAYGQAPVLGTVSTANRSGASRGDVGSSAAPGEIIVTAQRRSENLQKVPIAITVVGGDALKTNNFTSITDTQYLAPSLKFTPAPFASSFSIRGVGSQAFDYSVESSVGVALDDVIQTLPRTLSLNNLADIERIEVLRGPQGTLFGKNTSAGLISIVTKKPALGQFSSEGHIQYGTRNQVQTYAIVNLPVSETIAARFRAAYQRRDPEYHNLSTGSLPTYRDYELNGKILWEPSDTFSLYAIGDYQKSNSDPGVWAIRSFGTGTTAPGLGNNFVKNSAVALGLVPGPKNTDVDLNGDNSQTTSTYGGQITATLELGSDTLTSITAYKHLKYRFILDSDTSPLTALDNDIGFVRAHETTEEIRLASPANKLISYVIGGFYYNQKVFSTQQQSGGLGFLPNNFPLELAAFGGLQNFGVTTQNYAAFGDVTIKPVDRFRIFGGLRYTHDKISSSQNFTNIPGVCGFELLFAGICHATPLPSPAESGRVARGAVTGRGGFEFDVTQNVMAYATVARGYKGAGITGVSGDLRNIRPETVWSEELGLKTQFFDRKLTLNIAAFHAKYTNFQTQVFDPTILPNGAFVTGNAGGLKTQGVEAEASAHPIDGLSLSGGFAYTDAKFLNYQPACFAGQTVAQGCTLPGPTFDASGMRLINAPRWTYNLSAAYNFALSHGLSLFLNGNYSYRSSVIFGIGDPKTRQSGYGIANISAGVGPASGAYRVNVFVQNLADKRFASEIFQSTFDVGGYSQIFSDQAFRRVGVSLDFHM